MSSLRVLVFVLVLAQLGVLVESGAGDSSSLEVKGSELWDLYQHKVYLAEWMIRPLSGFHRAMSALSHSGVRVTLMNGDQWLIEKGPNYDDNSKTVVVDANNMSSKWRLLQRKYFFGRKTVGDFVRAGGKTYDPLFENCHQAADAMMRL